MKRILVSQRRDRVADRTEVRDALDVRLCAFLWDLGFLPVPVSSGITDVQEYLRAIGGDAVLLSGGNDIGAAPERDRVETELLILSSEAVLPVFGICRGLQMINFHQGGRLIQRAGHVAVHHAVTGPLVGTGRSVNSYHNMVVTPESLGKDLEAIAWSEDGSIEAVRHREMPWLAVMWHPERDETPSHVDQSMIQRHFRGGGGAA